jgi:hypothetical protein
MEMTRLQFCVLYCSATNFSNYLPFRNMPAGHGSAGFHVTSHQGSQKKMKYILQACAAVLVTLTAASAIAAPVSANANACEALAKRLSQKSAEFVQVNADGKAPAQSPKVHLANFSYGMGKKDTALHDAANEVWTLRTEMASRNCSQAEAFAY